jgi:putative transposase
LILITGNVPSTKKAAFQAKVANGRKDILHKIATQLVKQYDIIVLENLKIKNMMNKRHVDNAISNYVWLMLRQMITYKCQQYRKQLSIVDAKNTSSVCNACHHKNHNFDELLDNQ